MKPILLVALVLMAITGQVYGQKKGIRKIVATVNGHPIYEDEFNQAYNQSLLIMNTQAPPTRKKVLDDLINRQIGILRAKKNKLDNNPIVKRKMEDILYHAQISKDLEPRLKQIVVSNRDIKRYYRKNPEYRTAHILLRVRAKPTPQEAQEAQKRIFQIYAELNAKPQNFTQLANRYSQSNLAPNGGDMGFQPAVRLAPMYFKAIKGKKIGQITRPVRTQFGYHVIKILGIKKYKEIDRPLYKKIVYDQKRDQILAQYFKELQKSAKVKILRQDLAKK